MTPRKQPPTPEPRDLPDLTQLKALVDGVTVRRLCDAVRAGDLDGVRAIIAVRPELVHLDLAENDEHRALHYAVLQRQPEMVRFLMKHGADARTGIWPHRDATSPLTIATERGYTDIVDIIRDEERRRSHAPALAEETQSQAQLGDAFQRGDEDARRAIASGDTNWLRAHHIEGALASRRGLITHAVKSDRFEMLSLLLEFGLDPDERERVDGLEEVVYSWGAPLRECAIRSQTVMAEMLLQHGANPNTNVYAASSAMYEALARDDSRMVRLLENHGGIVNATTAAYLGRTDRVRQLFEDEKAGRLPDGAVSPGGNVADAVLEAAADGGHIELVRMVLDHLDWPLGDARWYGMLMRPFGKHQASDRERCIACFRMMLQRSGVNLPHHAGRTLLHDVAASWPRTAPMGAEERISFATILLDAGARLDLRDDLLMSTPLGWACRWGQVELVRLLLERGADPIEVEAESWATPRAWAEKMNHDAVLSLLREHGKPQS